MTVVDWDGMWGRQPNAEVAVQVDVDRFLGELVDGLAALDRGVRRSPS
jgi:inosine-uridine nucleoside N-ribohydrolase